MPTKKRIKRKILRQAVEENLTLLSGKPPAPRRGPSARARRRRRLALVLFPILAFGGSTYVLSRALSTPNDVLVVTQIMESAPAKAQVAETPEPADFPAPNLIEPSVFRLGVRRIVLDPGHGGVNVGTVAPGGLQEKDLALDISQRLRPLLEKASFEVVMTRDGDVAVPLQERTRLAKEEGADLFVSIHLNWIEAQQVRGVETYYLGATEDPYLNALAASENAESGYSLADFRRLVEGVYAGVRQNESRRLAQSVQRQLYRSLKRINPQIRDRGVKTAPFVVLVTSEMPAVLVEVSCLSNEAEARLLRKPYYRQYIAEALASGIGQYAESLVPSPELPLREASLATEERL